VKVPKVSLGRWLIRARPCDAVVRRVIHSCECGERDTYPRSAVLSADICCPHNLVTLNKINLWHGAELFEGGLGEDTSVTLDVAVIDMAQAGTIMKERVSLLDGLQKVHVVLHKRRREAVLEHDDVRVVDSAMGVFCQ
jgi:hypothetical protein